MGDDGRAMQYWNGLQQWLRRNEATRNCMFKVERSTRTRKAHRNASSHRIAANKEVKLKDKSHDCSVGTCSCTVGP
jgi:hypothetical protein